MTTGTNQLKQIESSASLLLCTADRVFSNQLSVQVRDLSKSSYSLGVLYKLYAFVFIDNLNNSNLDQIKETTLLSKIKNILSETSNSKFFANFLAEIENGLIDKMHYLDLDSFTQLFDFLIANFEYIFGTNNCFHKDLIIPAVQVNLNNYLTKLIEQSSLGSLEELNSTNYKILNLIKYLNKLQLLSGQYLNLFDCIYTYFIRVLKSNLHCIVKDPNIFISHILQLLLVESKTPLTKGFTKIFSSPSPTEIEVIELIKVMISIKKSISKFEDLRSLGIVDTYPHGYHKSGGQYEDIHAGYDFITDELNPLMNFRIKSLYKLYKDKFPSSNKLILLNHYLGKEGFVLSSKTA